MDFAYAIIQWYEKNKRDLPWRSTKDPYTIWLSEIILQQTRVAQGMPYFYKFKIAFPTVADLANATEHDVLRLWQGLGYYSRARNLHKTAQHVTSELSGEFPQNYDGLLKLKGVGSYTAAAIASFSFDEKVPVVDGNVFRVLSRFFDIETDIQSHIAKEQFRELAAALIPEGKAAVFNQAIMEFGALQCVPKSPDCESCPLNGGCLAFGGKKVAMLPFKSKKMRIRNRYLNYLIFVDEIGNTIIQERTQKGIWRNLYEFPLIEIDKELPAMDLELQIRNQTIVENAIDSILKINSKSQVHKLTHQHLHITFWKINVIGILANGINYDTLLTYPFPIVLFNFIERDWK